MSPTPRTAFIKGLPISLAPIDQVLADIGRAIERREPGHYISITNTEAMYHGLRVPAQGAYIRGADYSLCDGVGVVAAGLAWGHRIRRLNGPVLQLECSSHGVARGWRHFFYGGKEGVAEAMAARLAARFPGLEVCGTYCPPFREHTPEEDEVVVRLINDARPDIVWVGLGLLKQERWIAAHLGRVNAPWMIGVGASFDYLSGTIPWAPPLLRRLGLEWVFRLALQPRLRGRRYWWSFVYVLEATTEGLVTGRFLRGRLADRPATAGAHGISIEERKEKER
jgi:N-acetylglucosaminyldiphosphoundecaprenol N-acetyl-beta-D-mannosaminyltransferase